jgi:glucose/arabinose dehydrogenase
MREDVILLVGNDLYVADTDAVVRFAYTTGQTQITAPGVTLCELPGGPIDHHWVCPKMWSRAS